MSTGSDQFEFTFPRQLDLVKLSVFKEVDLLKEVDGVYADAISSGGLKFVG